MRSQRRTEADEQDHKRIHERSAMVRRIHDAPVRRDILPPADLKMRKGAARREVHPVAEDVVPFVTFPYFSHSASVLPLFPAVQQIAQAAHAQA